MRGRWPESEAALRRSIELARSFDGAFPAIVGGQRLALIETAQGRYAEAHRRIHELLAASLASTNPMVRVHTPARLLATAARNRFEAGDLDAATDYLAQGFAEQAASAARNTLARLTRQSSDCPTCDVMLYPTAVPIYLAADDLPRAELATRKAEQTALLFRSPAWRATARVCHGLLAAARQEWPAAARSFEAALRTFEALGQPYDIARTAEALADVADASGTGAGLAWRRRAADIYQQLGSPRGREAAGKGRGSAPA